MKIKVVNKSKFELPEYKTNGSAGMDLKANIDNPITLKPMEIAPIPTGIYVSIPEGYEGQIRPRSGLALNHGITLINCVGTIDSDYRGEIKVPLINLSQNDFTINPGDRIAQLVIAKYERAELITVSELDSTERGEGGFGHTGI